MILKPQICKIIYQCNFRLSHMGWGRAGGGGGTADNCSSRCEAPMLSEGRGHCKLDSSRCGAHMKEGKVTTNNHSSTVLPMGG